MSVPSGHSLDGTLTLLSHDFKQKETTIKWHKKPLTISKRILTNFSDSPRYFEVSVEEDTLKNVVPHSVATAFAKRVFPVPGGPTINTP